MSIIDYKAAGVDIEAGNEAVRSIKKSVESTFSPQVLTGIGSFGAMYDLKDLLQDYEHPVLVQSIDGVGTKMMVAKMMQKFDTIGIDLVSATTNDIIVLGAKPLTLLDYIANDKLKPETIEQIIKGMVKACKENHISLVGGETAEMPGTYLPGELDLVGVITGVVEKNKAIQGKEICEGDLVVTFPSSGLHTNGYSLARKLLFDVAGYKVESHFQDFSQSIGEELLTPHLNYTRPVLSILGKNIPIKGMAHITGGGLLENIPRILPVNCAVEIHKKKIPELPIFNLLRKLGHLDDEHMYRTFNMGAGLVLFIAPETLSAVRTVLHDFPSFPLYEIGQVVKGQQKVTLL
ncbi:phosphoribosylformylglycinamidine cyclo-ligase [Fluoribacter dumoffii]|uniref:Phosphoribosylformylglycinamidine cyclo-ligase n=1 Tax=Fluoribacter dumoffii TaxID=463 RepID=A0A377GEP8_9GAMM|nr:phosphoribosylformylglycinamidine cyclo-ligase [Fluoribacter dumoffii]KTC91348.1 phosphoribosylformylglycinamidine cyclo ligase [Fluoribacter dumoffii NY 23]MCW8387524.1 phosphoribosylformylglycinamidine cyclo-ligase [Fluoribacter dumoffii]MCW8416968.1 phosphoribosylformylglycinamidine cyclo-ligase [Fluoribacter dumoffii]MCW8455192.1 phosphoribosylformylglycinamidine cyclo-ligase [Fluoribacter dumoffii]MCW8460731.1 phosphoribosylformylglycinamidine cyclo-ligase [Fluoribacter dumoffii]